MSHRGSDSTFSPIAINKKRSHLHNNFLYFLQMPFPCRRVINSSMIRSMICSQAVLARASRAAKQAARAGRMLLGQKRGNGCDWRMWTRVDVDTLIEVTSKWTQSMPIYIYVSLFLVHDSPEGRCFFGKCDTTKRWWNDGPWWQPWVEHSRQPWDVTVWWRYAWMLICIKLYSPKANKEGFFVKVMVFGLPDLRVKRLSWKVHCPKRGCRFNIVCLSNLVVIDMLFLVSPLSGTYHQFDLQRASPAIRPQPNSCTDYIGANWVHKVFISNQFSMAWRHPTRWYR